MAGNGKITGSRIRSLYLRLDPNLETVCFCTLLRYYPAIARQLGFTQGRINYLFISTFEAWQRGRKGRMILGAVDRMDLEKQIGEAHFNVGGQFVNGWDSHGRPDSDQLCSLEVVLDDYDFLGHRQEITPLIQRVMKNDAKARAISRHRHNLRDLLTAVSVSLPNKPQMVLEWGILALSGVLSQAKSGVRVDEVFNPRVIRQGVETYLEACTRRQTKPLDSIQANQQYEWWCRLYNQAHEISDKHWEMACRDLERAEEKGWAKEVMIQELNQRIWIVSVSSESYKAGAACRSRKLDDFGNGYGLVIQWHRDGTCQIHSSTIRTENGRKYRLIFGPLAANLRQWEASFQNREILRGQDLRSKGFVLFEDEQVCPGFLTPTETGFFWGCRSAPDSPQTGFKPGKLFSVVCQNLPSCPVKEVSWATKRADQQSEATESAA